MEMGGWRRSNATLQRPVFLCHKVKKLIPSFQCAPPVTCFCCFCVITPRFGGAAVRLSGLSHIQKTITSYCVSTFLHVTSRETLTTFSTRRKLGIPAVLCCVHRRSVIMPSWTRCGVMLRKGCSDHTENRPYPMGEEP